MNRLVGFILSLFAGLALGQPVLVTNASQLSAAISDADPGDVIELQNGTWTNLEIDFVADGTAAQPITLRAQTPGAVVLNGSSRLEIGGDYLIVEGLRFENGAIGSGDVIGFRSGSTNANHSILRDVAMVSYNPASRDTRYFWVTMYGTHNTIERCLFEDQDHSGVTVVVRGDWPNHHVIRDNLFRDRPVGGENGWETIRVGTSDVSHLSSATTIENNLFLRCDGEIEIISGKTGDNIYKSNTFRASKGTLTLRHGSAARVHGNFFLGEGISESGGLRVIGPDHRVWNNYFAGLPGRTDGIIALEAGEPNNEPSGYEPVTNVVVAHNTIVDCGESAFILNRGLAGSRSILPTGVSLVGNLISLTGETVSRGANSGVTWNQNVAFAAGLGTAPSSGVSVLGVDPLSVADGELMRPASNGGMGSAVIDAITSPLDFVLDDMDGQPRDAAPDIGADEVAGVITSRGPLGEADVGPSWLGNKVDPGPDPGDAPDPSRGAMVEAELPEEIIDPNRNGVVYTSVSVAAASGGAVLKSPDGPRSDSGDEETTARYELTFPEAGRYILYYKARGFSGSSDSFFRPVSPGGSPTVSESTSNNGQFRWEITDSFEIAGAGQTRDLVIGRREAETEIDVIIAYPEPVLTTGELDALVAVFACRADANFDGLTDAFDVLAFLGMSAAALGLSPFEIANFLAEVEAGCD